MRFTAEQVEAYNRKHENRRLTPSAEPQPAVCHEPVATQTREGTDSKKIVVRITSFRRRLLDPDNLTGGTKYFLDGIRYAGIIPQDTPDKIKLQVEQVKVKTKADERTEIEIL